MATYQEANEQFKKWLETQYKAVVASQLYRGFLTADAFLTGLSQQKALLKSTPDQINEYMDDLNRNRLFKNEHREVMALLPRLKRSLCEFIISDGFDEPHISETAVISEEADSVINAIEQEEKNGQKITIKEAQIAYPFLNTNEPINGTVAINAPKPRLNPHGLTDAEKILHIYECCPIRLEGYTISKEDITQKYLQYLADHSDKDDHNILLSLGLGSVTFAALAVTYGVFSCLVKNSSDTESIIADLQPGDRILYKNGVREFQGFEDRDGTTYLLAKQNGVTRPTLLPPQAWKDIKPYNGKSTTLDGRGIRRSTGIRELFYKKILGYDDKDIPSLTNTSCVIVISREKADYLMENLAIDFDGHTVRILDLVTASYFTESGEYTYAGNTGKNEAVLKFAGKLDVARQQIVKRKGNKALGFIIADEDNIVRNESELPEILNRQALNFANVVGNINDSYVQHIIEGNESASLFACTTDFLLSCNLQNTFYNTFTYKLYRGINTQIDHTSQSVVVEGGPTWKDMYDFRKAIYAIRTSGGNQQAIELYITYAWSALKLLNQALFDINTFDLLAQQSEEAYTSFAKRLEIIKNNEALLPTFLEPSFRIINDILDRCRNQLADTNPKLDKLVSLLYERSDSKICVVVPSVYFIPIVKRVVRKAVGYDKVRFPVVQSASKFEPSSYYDTIIVTGNITSRKFDALRCSSAIEIISLVYGSENNLFIKRVKDAHHIEMLMNKRSSVPFIYDENDENEFDSGAGERDVVAAEEQEQEIDQLIRGWESNSLISYYTSSGTGSQESDVAVLVSFDSGEKAFLTPNYKAYVYNPAVDEITDTAVSDLCEGDTLVFTKHDNETKDIVDDILHMLTEKGRLGQDDIKAYNMSKKWKNALLFYMKFYKLTPRKLAQDIVKSGLKLSETTVVNWMDEDSHIVGPQKAESIRIIGKFTGSKELEQNAEEYHNACKRIWQIRKLILKNMSQAMRDKLSGKQKPVNDQFLSVIYERLDSRAEILTIERIIDIDGKKPNTMVNRPFSI